MAASTARAGLAVVDVKAPAAPTIVATLDVNGDDPEPNDAGDVTAFAHCSNPVSAGTKPFEMMAYVADGAAGVRIVDLNDPSAPSVFTTVESTDARAVVVKSHYDLGSSTEASLEREYLYIADGADGLRIVNVSDPASPVPVTTLSSGGAVHDLLVANAFEPPKNKAYLYAALGAGGCAIIDVSDVSAPALVATVPVAARRGLAIESVDLDRLVDEDGKQITDLSHEGARPFRREEMERILEAPL